jgi:hypothetical protein
MEITFVLILVYLILSRSSAFSQIIAALGRLYVGGVVALQGRRA